MSIVVSCSSCKHNMKVPDLAAGRSIRCSRCRTSIQVPDGSSRIIRAGGGAINKLKSMFGLK
jgi:LSD1 subclass zinc finger protein